MVDLAPSFEMVDNQGSSAVSNHVIGTSWSTLYSGPSVSLFIDIPSSGNPASSYVDLSLNGGSTYFRLNRGQNMSWPLRGVSITLSVKASHAGLSLQLIENYDD